MQCSVLRHNLHLMLSSFNHPSLLYCNIINIVCSCWHGSCCPSSHADVQIVRLSRTTNVGAVVLIWCWYTCLPQHCNDLLRCKCQPKRYLHQSICFRHLVFHSAIVYLAGSAQYLIDFLACVLHRIVIFSDILCQCHIFISHYLAPLKLFFYRQTYRRNIGTQSAVKGKS
nr:MAG TPA: hypothetical protein [Caudoviricetes sp.]